MGKVTRVIPKRPRVIAPAGPFASVAEAVSDIRRGKMVIVVDEEDRENEGDLTMAAELVTPEAVAFIRKYASGVICVPMTVERLQELDLPQMVSRNEARLGTAFTVSVDAREGVTTGISAADRAQTIKVLADPKTKAHDVVKPGHIFPLQARDGGVLVRAGQTEAAVDLCRLAGLSPVGVICEITNPDGSMSRMPELKRFARRHGLRLITVKDLIAHRMAQERLVERMATAKLPTEYGEFAVHGYRAKVGNTEAEHVALTMGQEPHQDSAEAGSALRARSRGAHPHRGPATRDESRIPRHETEQARPHAHGHRSLKLGSRVLRAPLLGARDELSVAAAAKAAVQSRQRPLVLKGEHDRDPLEVLGRRSVNDLYPSDRRPRAVVIEERERRHDVEAALVDDRLNPQARQGEHNPSEKDRGGDGRIQHDRREGATRENDRPASRLVPAA